jgi:hypothetical protein
VIGSIPLVIKDHYIAIRRIQSQVAKAMLPLVAGGMLELVGAAWGAHLGGIVGLSLGWLIAVCIEAAFMFLPVHHAIRKRKLPIQTPAESKRTEPVRLADTLVMPPVKLRQVYEDKYKNYQRQMQ